MIKFPSTLSLSSSVALSSAEHIRTMAMQNELHDLQRRFDETLAENKVLKQIQARQDRALGRAEKNKQPSS